MNDREQILATRQRILHGEEIPASPYEVDLTKEAMRVAKIAWALKSEFTNAGFDDESATYLTSKVLPNLI